MRANNVDYYKIPVEKDTRMIEGAVADACEAKGLKAVCAGPNGCQYNTDRCLVTPLSTNCPNPMIELSKALCNGKTPRDCSKTNGMFNYMHKWTYNNSEKLNGECGALNGKWCAIGQNLISGKDGDFFAYCVKPNGKMIQGKKTNYEEDVDPSSAVARG